jgi:hypothetical protein
MNRLIRNKGGAKRSAWSGPFNTQPLSKAVEAWRNPNMEEPPDEKLSAKVYMFECMSSHEDARLIKVGVSKDCERRLNDLQGTNPFPLELIFESPDHNNTAGRLEKWIHSCLSDYQISGEWFSLTDETIEHVKIFLLHKHLRQRLKPFTVKSTWWGKENWERELIDTGFLEDLWENCAPSAISVLPERDYLWIN